MTGTHKIVEGHYSSRGHRDGAPCSTRTTLKSQFKKHNLNVNDLKNNENFFQISMEKKIIIARSLLEARSFNPSNQRKTSHSDVSILGQTEKQLQALTADEGCHINLNK